jgi:hypothetical protein
MTRASGFLALARKVSPELTDWLTTQSDQTSLGAKDVRETVFTGKIQGILADTGIGREPIRPEKA